ncbi:MAG: ester cyclase [Myxococcota bacterium]|nr:ester cyclase [Myxococcota bacterium]
MTKSQNEIARAMVEDVYGKGEIQLIPQLCTDDYVSHDPMTGAIDRPGIESDVSTYRRAFPDLRMQILDAVDAGDKVSVRWRAVGTQQGELLGIPPTNKRATVEGITLVRFERGKAAESWVQYDTLGMLRQLGVLPQSLAAPAPRPDGRQQRAESPTQTRR